MAEKRKKEKENRLYMNILNTAVAILFATAILCLTSTFLLTNLGFHKMLNHSYSDIKDDKMLSNMIGYLEGTNSLDRDFFSEQALTHMEDVKRLMHALNIITIMLCIISACFLGYLIYARKEIPLMLTGIAIISICAIFLLSSLSFDRLFVVFHKIFFDNDLWMFPYDDTIVNLYTERFFMWFFIWYLGINLAIGTALAIYERIYHCCRDISSRL